ncbi:MAG: hypothetical protein LBB16_00360 [Puniceicoccales bacterium]|jgi:hypothetical protein|nr:hypothetical protein [Puniceicoccales bacterium]
MAKTDKHLLEAEEFDNFEILEGDSELNLYHSNIRNLIVSQLIVASPASLHFDTIFHGIVCLCKDCLKEHVMADMSYLVNFGSVIKISECGFGDRYRLADGCLPKIFDVDE